MRHEKLYLTDIVEAARAIEKFIMGEDFNEFEQNEMMNSAVLQKLSVIGEAASNCQKNSQSVFLKSPGRILSVFAILPCISTLPFVGILPGWQRQKKSQLCANRLNRFCVPNLLMNEKEKK
jgi:hypothetical protein